MNHGVVSGATPRMGLRPILGGDSAPAPPKTFLRKKNLRVSCPLPLVGTETYTLSGCLSRPWVTFSFGPTETGLGYIIKWLDRGHYSFRSVSTGSIRAARAAGKKHAARLVRTTSTITAAYG